MTQLPPRSPQGPDQVTDLPEGLHPQTLALRTAMPRSAYGEHSEALYLTSGYVQDSAEAAAARFAGDEEGFTYARYGNPTVATLEHRLAAMEGTEAAIATASGMSAILMLCLGLLKAGDHVVCSHSMFGATVKLLGSDLARFGVQCTFVSQTNPDEWAKAVTPHTRLLFAETPTNPLGDVCDIAALADIAHRAGALLAVDNCFVTPALQRPVDWGADVVVHSGTKYLDGQGRVMAGALCTTQALVQDKLLPMLRSGGMTLAPFNAWVVLKGLETLQLRLQAQSAQATQLAQWLQSQPGVAQVHYTGLPTHPQHALAMRQQSGQGGPIVSFDVRAASPEQARERAFAVINALRVLSRSTNIGDTKTLVTHPASTSHGRLSEAQRQAAGVGQGLLRVAVGLEHLDDIKADLLRGLPTA
ncbi:MAG: O-succinylhomoserine sulfhydrylase [Burkholderiaceae bacterium]